MKNLKWIPLFCSMLLFGQERDSTMYESKVQSDTLWYQEHHNSFNENDELSLLSYNPISASSQTNFGAPIISWYWQSSQTTNLRIGDRILDFGIAAMQESSFYQQKYPHTKIIYSQGYSEGQRLNFLHKRRYKYGAVELDYDRLVSKGYLWHEKNKYTRFSFQGDFKHPHIPYSSQWKIHTFKNDSEWNGGVSDDSLFLAGTQTNWELLPVNWTNLTTGIKHKGLDWRHSYRFSDKSELAYEIHLSQDSLFYEGLQDDTLFYPLRLDSTTAFYRSFLDLQHSLAWHRTASDKEFSLGLKHQNFSQEINSTNQLNIFASLKSTHLRNSIYLNYGLVEDKANSFVARYEHHLNLLGMNHQFKLAYEKTLPSWMQSEACKTGEVFYLTCILENQEPVIDQYVEWNMSLNQNFNIVSSYHNIDGFNYFNERAISMRSDESVQVFQSRLIHHLKAGKWHWRGDAIYQNSSSKNLPLANVLLNQKVYWQGMLFEEATEVQLGLRALYRSLHPGMTYAPLLGDFYVNPLSETDESLRADVFANFQIQTVKVYLAYEHFNGLWQGEQYILKPYPMARPTFRLSLIWNFYD